MTMMIKMNTDLDSQQMDFETLELKLIDGFIFIRRASLLFQYTSPLSFLKLPNNYKASASLNIPYAYIRRI